MSDIPSIDRDLQKAIVENQIIKSKILSKIFGVLFIFPTIGICYLLGSGKKFLNTELPTGILLFVPVFLLVIAISEFYVAKYLRRANDSDGKIEPVYMYLISILEVCFPTMVLYIACSYFVEGGVGTSVDFLNSPPSFMYFIFIILSSFLLDFKLSIFVGVMAALQFWAMVFVYVPVEIAADNLAFLTLFSKGAFFALGGVVAGLVSQKTREGVVSSLGAKNELIHTLDIKVKERTEEIELQKAIVEKKNEDIMDSIHYAKRIQEAILPLDEDILKVLPNSFVLFKPKDVVSGDFYWFAAISDDKTRCLITAADCTGHGVPGAFMSMIGNTMLNEIVNHKGYTDPGQILGELRDEIVKALKQREDGGSKDGMDMALCLCDTVTKKVIYSGAYNSLYIVREGEGEPELEEIKADKQPIGYHLGDHDPFTSHEIQLKGSDRIYILSDGYQDQFGGARGKKFMPKRLRKVLKEVSVKPFSEQKEILDQTIEEWRGEEEQVDDILVIGISL